VSHILSPTCPGCGTAPILCLDSQAFCENPGCSTLCWERTQTPEWNRANVVWHDAATGAVLTEEQIAALVEEAERGYELDRLDWTGER
jgi:hypothetical protein